jgi:hypothetical protein
MNWGFCGLAKNCDEGDLNEHSYNVWLSGECPNEFHVYVLKFLFTL